MPRQYKRIVDFNFPDSPHFSRFKRQLLNNWPTILKVLSGLILNQEIEIQAWTEYFNVVESFELIYTSKMMYDTECLVLEKLTEHFIDMIECCKATLRQNPNDILTYHDDLWSNNQDGFTRWRDRYRRNKKIYPFYIYNLELKFPTMRYLLLFLWQVTNDPFERELMNAIKESQPTRTGEGTIIFKTLNILDVYYSEISLEIDDFVRAVDLTMIGMLTKGLDRGNGRLWQYPLSLRNWLSLRAWKRWYIVKRLLKKYNLLIDDSVSFIYRDNPVDVVSISKIFRDQLYLELVFKETIMKQKNIQINNYVLRVQTPEGRLWALIDACHAIIGLDLRMPERDMYITKFRIHLFRNLPVESLRSLIGSRYVRVLRLRPRLNTSSFEQLITSFYIRCKIMNNLRKHLYEKPSILRCLAMVWDATMDDPAVMALDVKPKSFQGKHMCKFLAKYFDFLLRMNEYQDPITRPAISEKVIALGNTAVRLDIKRFLALCFASTRERLLRNLTTDLMAHWTDMREALDYSKTYEFSTYRNIFKMFEDIAESQRLERDFYTWRMGVPEEEIPNQKYSYRVLTNRAWHQEIDGGWEHLEIHLPHVVHLAHARFDEFYRMKKPDKKLTWNHDYSFCLVTFHSNRGSYDLWMSAHQYAIVMCFEEQPYEWLSFDEISYVSGITRRVLMRVLLTLVRGKEISLMFCQPPLDNKDNIGYPKYRFAIDYDLTMVRDREILKSDRIDLIQRLWLEKPDLTEKYF